MTKFEKHNEYTFSDIEDIDSTLSVALSNQTGITILPESFSCDKQLTYNSMSGDFKKWARIKRPEILVNFNSDHPKIILHSADFLMPLVVLASDITLSFYLNLVSDYLYNCLRGTLKGESKTIKIRAIINDKKAKRLKEFEFEGDHKALKIAIKKIDINKFMDE